MAVINQVKGGELSDTVEIIACALRDEDQLENLDLELRRVIDEIRDRFHFYTVVLRFNGESVLLDSVMNGEDLSNKVVLKLSSTELGGNAMSFHGELILNVKTHVNLGSIALVIGGKKYIEMSHGVPNDIAEYIIALTTSV